MHAVCYLAVVRECMYHSACGYPYKVNAHMMQDYSFLLFIQKCHCCNTCGVGSLNCTGLAKLETLGESCTSCNTVGAHCCPRHSVYEWNF